jgi:hypothetical protein
MMNRLFSDFTFTAPENRPMTFHRCASDSASPRCFYFQIPASRMFRPAIAEAKTTVPGLKRL